MEKYSRAMQTTGDNMTHVHYMLATKATNTHSECVIIFAFPLQIWFHECDSVFCQLSALLNVTTIGASRKQ